MERPTQRQNKRKIRSIAIQFFLFYIVVHEIYTMKRIFGLREKKLHGEILNAIRLSPETKDAIVTKRGGTTETKPLGQQ